MRAQDDFTPPCPLGAISILESYFHAFFDAVAVIAFSVSYRAGRSNCDRPPGRDRYAVHILSIRARGFNEYEAGRREHGGLHRLRTPEIASGQRPQIHRERAAFKSAT